MSVEQIKRVVNTAPAYAAALAVIPMLLVVIARRVDVPYWDEWSWADLAFGFRNHSLTFAQLWEAHNEHRIFGANAFMLALDAIGGWSVVREQIASLAFLATTQFFFWNLIRQTIAHPWRGWFFFVSTLYLFSFTQEENFSWGFQLAWFACNLGAVVAIWSLGRPARSKIAVTLSVLAAIVASLTSTQGLAAWVGGAVVLAIAGRRPSWSTLAIWLAFATATIAIVRFGVTNGDPAQHLGLNRSVDFIVFMFAYLGSPVARSFRVAPDVAPSGLFVLIALVGLVAVGFRGSPDMRNRLAPWLGIGGYVLCCALLTARARGVPGIAYALVSRYTTISNLGWAAIVAGIFAVLSFRPRSRRLSYAATGLLVILAVATIAQSVAAEPDWVDVAQQLRTARAELEVGDSRALGILNPSPRNVVIRFGWLDSIHDGLFSERGREKTR